MPADPAVRLAALPEHLAAGMIEDISKRCFKGSVRPNRDWIHGDGAFTGYRLEGSLPARQDAERCLTELGPYLEDCDAKVAAQQLVKLAVACVPRSGDDATGAMRAAVYRDLVSDYPADVVIWAVQAWITQPPEVGRWYPAYAELKDLLDRRMKRRLALAEIARSICVAHGQPRPEAVRSSKAHPDAS